MFKTIITFPIEVEERLKKICKDIEATSKRKGEEFDYKFNGNKLIVIKERESSSYAVGFWFRQKANYSEDERENKRWRRKIHFEVVKC